MASESVYSAPVVSATIDQTASDGTAAMTYTLSDTLASSISVRGNSPRPDELITLTYSKITTKPAGCD